MSGTESLTAVAIDGPSGAGKSTIARILAKELGYIYVDTGALYRAVGYHAIQRGKNPSDSEGVKSLLPSTDVALRYVGGEQKVFVNEEDVTQLIRTPEVSMAASAVSAIPEVRAFLFDLQQEIARRENVIMDGRDIGTVVLPNAKIKLFLTASAEDRAKRRYNELCEKGENVSYDDVLSDMKKRDHDDANRTAAPLKQADDAILADTTGNTLEQSVALLKKMILEKLG